tara:strand:+ start:1024 stop:2490 length:1467 start_codon:yes stop_codon:yes gene_type:complete
MNYSFPKISQKDYYQGTDFGNYQFISLDEIINQFQIAYVGEDKLIPKIKRSDISFHAHRALAELSFDVFKSYKSQEIVVPPSLTMVLPHDYINYTKLSRVDNNGIKRVLYPTSYTSNPFQIKQEDDGSYVFNESPNLLLNGDFSEKFAHWKGSGNKFSKPTVLDSVLNFVHTSASIDDVVYGPALAAWQQIDVSNVDYITISADGVAVAASGAGANAIPAGVLRFGLSTQQGDFNVVPVDTLSAVDVPQDTQSVIQASQNATADIFDIAYLEWNGETSTQQLNNIDVSQYNTVFVLITSLVDHTNNPTLSLQANNTIDNIVVQSFSGDDLQHASEDGLTSSTWSNYKSFNYTQDVDDYRYPNRYIDMEHRYGLKPELAQTNGSFYIDDRIGRIHFSSNINGKTVILDYISDGHGTDAEMQVPKLAEEAMYKHILYDVISTRSNIGGGRLAFHKKEKFAAVRKAKLRLSNIKLEELTQILRGQSKHIKH